MTAEQLAGSNGLYGRCTLAGFLRAQKRLGVKRLALHHLPAHVWMDHIRTIGGEELCRSLEQEGCSIVSLHPGRYHYSLFEPASTLRGQATLSYHRRCLDLAQALHCPTLCLRPAGSLQDSGRKAGLETLVEQLRQLCSDAEARSITVCLQTVTPEEGALLHTLEDLRSVLEQVPQAGALLDTVPMSCAGETIHQWFEVFGPRIRHVRFQDGRSSGCRIWGEGVYPSRRYAAQLHRTGYSGPITLLDCTQRYQDAPETADARNWTQVRALLDGLEKE